MDMTGEYRIPASRAKVWEALNDPETLKASLPGCESLEKVSDQEFAATVVAKVGPVKAKFNGNVTLSNLNPPQSYTISGEGKGGAAGFAKGGADISLAEDGDVTVLTYTAKADVGGKLAQLGSRLIDGTARKMADEFFTNFCNQVAPPAPPAVPAEPEPAAAPSAAAAPLQEGLMQNKFVWAAAAIVLLMILVLLFR
jgi:carbon monoxide dehydrogenase subunit G